jgi:cytochrome c oxidase cbb3-type subunit 3/ubiquinol-cytochrome c reductase cytochrome c subunit
MPAFAWKQGGPLTDAQVQVLAEGIKPRWGKQPAVAQEKVPPYLAQGGGNAERGMDVFMRACAMCHSNKVRPINDPAFLALISNQALRRFVITGRPDLGMPSYAEKRPEEPDFKPLTATEVTDLVALLASWAPTRPGRKGKDQPSRGSQ